MAAETITIACAEGVYTALSSADTDVMFRSPPGGGRFVLASSQPSAGETNFFPVQSNELISLSSLDANVYFMPNAGAVSVYVVRV